MQVQSHGRHTPGKKPKIQITQNATPQTYPKTANPSPHTRPRHGEQPRGGAQNSTMILYQTRETLNTVAGLAQEMYLGEACSRAESDPIPPGEGVLCPYPRQLGSESIYHAFQASFH